MSKRKISSFSLILLIVAAIDSIRNLPASALFGETLIFFFIFSACVFLIPTALVAAELSAMYPEEGGVYHWVRKALGEKCGMLALWLQWMNTIIWYPTILSFIAGTAAYFVDPSLVQDKVYLIGVILTVFWTLTFLNLQGLRITLRVNEIFALIGTIFPLCLLIALAFSWLLRGQPIHIDLTFKAAIPVLTRLDTWTALIGVMASFLGMELAGVHVTDVKNPQKNFPRALFCAGGFILFSMIFGSLAIALVIPNSEINLVAGVMQVFTTFFETLGVGYLIPYLTGLIVLGSIGGMINWLISPIRGLLHAAEFGFLPAFFTKTNGYGAPHRLLFTQAVCVSSVCLVFLLVPSVNAFYWFLTSLSTQLYMVMYVLMFTSALLLHHKFPSRKKTFKIPGKTTGMWICCLLGIFGSFSTILVGFIPPPHIEIGSALRYALLIGMGNAIALSPVFLFFMCYKRNRKA